MYLSLSTFGALLSELQTYFKGRISQSVLFPVLALVLGLAAVLGYSLGWDTTSALWKGLDTQTVAVLTAVAVLGFLFLVYVLGSLQALVTRGFQGEWPDWAVRLSGQLDVHQKRWAELRESRDGVLGLYQIVMRSQDLLTQYTPPVSTATVVRCRGSVAAYQVLRREDLTLGAPPRSSETATGQTFSSIDRAVGQMTTRALADGALVTSDAVLPLLTTTLLDGMVLAPVSLDAEAVPGGVGPGSIVELRDRLAAAPTLLNRSYRPRIRHLPAAPRHPNRPRPRRRRVTPRRPSRPRPPPPRPHPRRRARGQPRRRRPRTRRGSPWPAAPCSIGWRCAASTRAIR